MGLEQYHLEITAAEVLAGLVVLVKIGVWAAEQFFKARAGSATEVERLKAEIQTKEFQGVQRQIATLEVLTAKLGLREDQHYEKLTTQVDEIRGVVNDLQTTAATMQKELQLRFQEVQSLEAASHLVHEGLLAALGKLGPENVKDLGEGKIRVGTRTRKG